MEVYLSLYRLKEAGMKVYFCWVTAHVGYLVMKLLMETSKKSTIKMEVDVKVPMYKYV